MSRQAFYLESCSTCKRILKEIDLPETFEMREIKSVGITAEEIDKMHALSGSYESLFSRRAMKYRAMGLHEKELNENDYRSLILSEYTFLKRPVFIIDEDIFIGNTKKTVAAIKEKLQQL